MTLKTKLWRWASRWIFATKSDVHKILMNQVQLAQELVLLKNQITKIGTETSATLQKAKDLEAIIQAGGEVSQEVKDALAALKAQAQLTDDLVPDASAPPTPESPAQPSNA